MSDENINEVLGIEEPLNAENNQQKENIVNSAENTLVTIGNIILGAGIFLGILCLATICWDDSGYHKEFNPSGFAMTVGIILSSILTWAFLKVIANISKTLKEINEKIK